MNGYEVISVNDDKSIGHVSGRIGDFLIVEHGHLRKSHNPLPLEFAEVDEANNARHDDARTRHRLRRDPQVKDTGSSTSRRRRSDYGLAETQPADGYVEVDDHELKAAL